MDVFGKAVLDFQQGNYTEDIKTSSSLNEEDSIPIPYLFRTYKEMPKIEQKALDLCKGNVLDIGCGAGSHSLYLQKKGFNTTALDNSSGAIETCKLRGIKNCVLSELLKYKDATYDTLLLMMNGVGLARTTSQLAPFLMHLSSLLNSGGQIILDSSDIIYMFDSDVDGGVWVPNTVDYYGEVTFTMTYKNHTSPPFNWLYLDFMTLQKAAISVGLQCEMVLEGSHYDYLARLTKI